MCDTKNATQLEIIYENKIPNVSRDGTSMKGYYPHNKVKLYIYIYMTILT